MTSHPGRLSADFEPDHRYKRVFDKGRQVYFVDGADGRCVASVPVGFGGKVCARADTWMVGPERRRRGWEIVARSLDGDLAGGIREGLLPCTFKLRVADGNDYRVTESPIDGHWTVSHGSSCLARISGVATFARAQPPKEPKRVPAGMVSPFGSPEQQAWSGGILGGEITTSGGTSTSPPPALAILLTLEMIKAEAGMPTTTASEGSGYSL